MLSAPTGLSVSVESWEGAAGVDTTLMARFRDRRASADFEALYDRARRDLLAWITTLARGRQLPHDPIDLLQDTFVNIYRYAGPFRNEQPTSFRVWSRRIAMNVVRRARIPRREDPLPEGCFEPADFRSGPGESASSLEQSRELAGAWLILLGHYAEVVLELRERDRTALGLIEVSGLSYAEAASRLGVGASNMKMIVFRARKRIRREIARRLGALDLLESEAA